MTTLSTALPLLLVCLLQAIIITAALPAERGAPPTMTIISSPPATPNRVKHTDWSYLATKQYCTPNQNATHTCQLFVQSNNMIAPGSSDVYIWGNRCNIRAEKRDNKLQAFELTSILVGGYEITVLPGGEGVSILTDNGATTGTWRSQCKNSLGWSDYVKACRVPFPC